MNEETDYLKINRQSWNDRVDPHTRSEFYDLEGFRMGNTSLKEIEIKLLGDVKGKDLLHLQCHFGQDTLSLSRMGANVTGVDLSDKAIDFARSLSKEINAPAEFVCSDIYSLPKNLHKKFDIVFTSYGTITWLPDLNKWAQVISKYL